MAFDQSHILDITASLHDADMLISWRTTAPSGTLYQVYSDRTLVWHGTATRCLLPHPAPSKVRIDVGAVGSNEGLVDWSSSLPAAPGQSGFGLGGFGVGGFASGGPYAKLTWRGGSYLGPTIRGFRVYSGPTPGGAVSYARPLASLTAYAQDRSTDGFGMGGFGLGGFGFASATYSWAGGPLANGTWHFAVKAFDLAGNEGPPRLIDAVIAAPPGPPASDGARKRLTYTFNHGTSGGFGEGGFGLGAFGVGSVVAGFGLGGFGDAGFGFGSGATPSNVTLNWLASPG